MRSVHRFLLIALLMTVCAATATTAYFSYRDGRHEVEELFDAQLARSSRLLRGLIGHHIEDNDLNTLASSLAEEVWLPTNVSEGSEATPWGHTYENKLAYQVLDPEGNMVMRSSSAPHVALAIPVPGFSDKTVGPHAWRVFNLHDDESGYWCISAEMVEVRQDYIGRIVFRSVLPMILGLPVLALLIWLIIRRGLQPLSRLAKEISARPPTRLEPIELTAVPAEIRQIVVAMNQLFDRLGQAFAREKRFTADAAHELRTPLAALQIHAENALNAQSDLDRNRSLECVLKGVRRMTHLVTQLLTMSRLEPEAITLRPESFDMERLARDLLAEMTPLAMSKNIELSLHARTGDHTLIADEVSVGILLRNLVDNGIRYSPPGRAVDVQLQRLDDRYRVAVSDRGPGLPSEFRERVFERFFRSSGTREDGSGLGLAIVRRIADLHHAAISLDSGPGATGLCVCVDFPCSGSNRPFADMPAGQGVQKGKVATGA
jgi:two-component system sensor histidine kinase QseC